MPAITMTAPKNSPSYPKPAAMGVLSNGEQNCLMNRGCQNPRLPGHDRAARGTACEHQNAESRASHHRAVVALGVEVERQLGRHDEEEHIGQRLERNHACEQQAPGRRLSGRHCCTGSMI